MAELDLDAIGAYEQAAPKGPWRVERHEPSLTNFIVSADHALDLCLGYVGNRTEAEAAFIVNARRDVPDLVAELRQARQRIDELERDRAGRPDWSDGRDLAIRLRDEQATDDEIRDVFWGLWGGDGVSKALIAEPEPDPSDPRQIAIDLIHQNIREGAMRHVRIAVSEQYDLKVLGREGYAAKCEEVFEHIARATVTVEIPDEVTE